MNIAVVGGGISGITAAFLLAKRHSVTLFEKNDYLGGHTNTRVVTDEAGRPVPVDTGFIVCNPTNYPNFYQLLSAWGVSLQDSNMSFGFHCEKSGVTYVGPTLGEALSLWENFFSPQFIRFLYQRWRFNCRIARDLADGALQSRTLGSYLDELQSDPFLVENYLAPLIGSIWSGPDSTVRDFPAATFARFFDNHGMLDFRKIPRWQTVQGGSHAYLQGFRNHFTGTIFIESPVASVRRRRDGCSLQLASGVVQQFDKVVFACHADETLSMLEDPSEAEREALESWSYSTNHTVLHTDTRVMPPDRRAWAAWNYHRSSNADSGSPVRITYYMNKLQSLPTSTHFFVTLNRTHEIDPARIAYEITYRHPVYTERSIQAQETIKQLNGTNYTFFCGAHLGYGFHEDGVKSALEAAKHFGIAL
jgi:predicted NAD/FAD-binding protein